MGRSPEPETITFSDTFEDEFLSDACGVDVTTTLNGRITFLAFPDRPVGVQDITSVHVDLLASAGDNRVRFKDVGVDLVRISPDGTLTLMVVGQIPFDFTGALKVDLRPGRSSWSHGTPSTRLARAGCSRTSRARLIKAQRKIPGRRPGS